MDVKKKLDETIINMSKRLDEMIESEDTQEIATTSKALTELITARARLDYSLQSSLNSESWSKIDSEKISKKLKETGMELSLD